MDGLTVGRMVHFVNEMGTHKAAIVSFVLDHESGIVDLHVMQQDTTQPIILVRGIEHSDDARPLSWHWIERVGPAKASVTAEQVRAVFDQKALAKQAYYGYGSVTDFKNYQGLPMPEWEQLTDKIQQAWMAAARYSWNEGYQAATLPKSE